MRGTLLNLTRQRLLYLGVCLVVSGVGAAEPPVMEEGGKTLTTPAPEATAPVATLLPPSATAPATVMPAVPAKATGTPVPPVSRVTAPTPSAAATHPRDYAAGVLAGRALRDDLREDARLGVDLDREAFLSGLGAAVRGQPLALDEATLDTLAARLESERAQHYEAEREAQRQAGEVYRKTFTAAPGVRETDGVFYRFDRVGLGHRLKGTDPATLLITGHLADGTVFDDRGTRGQSITARVDTLQPFLRWGVEHVSPGGHFTAVVPPEKGYGDVGLPPGIPGGATLVFDVDVMSRGALQPEPAAPAGIPVSGPSPVLTPPAPPVAPGPVAETPTVSDARPALPPAPSPSATPTEEAPAPAVSPLPADTKAEADKGVSPAEGAETRAETDAGQATTAGTPTVTDDAAQPKEAAPGAK